MRNENEKFYNPARRLIEYLHDVIINELPTLGLTTKSEILEAKKNRIFFQKHLHAEFLTFVAVCIFLVVMIVISIRGSKSEEEAAEEEVEEIASTTSLFNDTVNESPEGSMYSIPMNANELKETFFRCDCGDSTTMTQLGELSAINLNNHGFINFTEHTRPVTRPSDISVHTAPAELPAHPHSSPPPPQLEPQQQQQQDQKFAPKKINEPHRRARTEQRRRDYDVRRTRSGLIYGKYPS